MLTKVKADNYLFRASGRKLNFTYPGKHTNKVLMNINVAIADDHPMIAQGIRLIFSNYPHISLSAVYKNGEELLLGLEKSLPDVLILDIQLPDKTGDELMPLLLLRYPDLKVLVLTNFESPMYASKMLWQGVKGFLLKTAEEDILVKAIEEIFKGGQYVEKELQDKLAQDVNRTKKMLTVKSSLTIREKEVLQLIVEGLTDQEIAARLFLGLDTVKHYRKAMLLKLDVKNTAALVSKALKMGLAQ